jgi:predicted RNA-binding protein with PIN domain
VSGHEPAGAAGRGDEADAELDPGVDELVGPADALEPVDPGVDGAADGAVDGAADGAVDGAADGVGADEPGWEGPLPEAVRLRVLALASEALGALPDDQVPATLRPFRRWAPARRTRLAATPLAAAVENDVIFRQKVASRVWEAFPDLAAGLDEGKVPAAADPVDVGAVAYLARPPGWAGLIAVAGADLERSLAAAESNQAAQTVAKLQESLAAVRAQGREELARLREELEAARGETAAVRRELREEKGLRRRAERAVAEAEERLAASVAAAAATASATDAELRRLRSRLAEAEGAVEAVRRATREGRSLEDTRLRLLLDTVVEAASGLRRELALPPTADRPADLVEAATPGESALARASERALLSDDPALLDQLLALPQVHLVVDGYNVTKTGFPDLPLEGQRTRLVNGLVALAARSGAEVTCCFDGATVQGRVPSMSGRGVRVLFSKPGEIADELIRRLVRAEPAGRPVVVVSSDREVADGVRRSGARPISAAALVRRLDRG